jgi:hypothetical protein
MDDLNPTQVDEDEPTVSDMEFIESDPEDDEMDDNTTQGGNPEVRSFVSFGQSYILNDS